ncbi:hypothetical protein E4U21_004399 [Claviceps maximensis]|nr:hypothetical protein E4U21_004399 [Claviceps maximensis]
MSAYSEARPITKKSRSLSLKTRPARHASQKSVACEALLGRDSPCQDRSSPRMFAVGAVLCIGIQGWGVKFLVAGYNERKQPSEGWTSRRAQPDPISHEGSDFMPASTIRRSSSSPPPPW